MCTAKNRPVWAIDLTKFLSFSLQMVRDAIGKKLYNMTFERIDLVWFYDISTIVGYLMPNPVFTYIYL